MRNIDGTLAENADYLALPVEWLHCLFDIGSWCHSQMGHHPMKRLFRAQKADENGEYKGMYDFVFNGSKDDLCRMLYREHYNHHFMPADSMGIMTIKNMPTSGPRLQEIKPFDKWGMLDTHSIQQTLAMVFRFARSVSNVQEQQVLISIWDKHISEVPTTIDLLLPEYKLVFRHFDNSEVPRLCAPAINGTQDELPSASEMEYESWLKSNQPNIRCLPMAYDPVVSSEQSEADVRKLQANYQLASRGHRGPTCSALSPIYPGEFVLASPAGLGGGIALYSIKKFCKGFTARAVDIQLECVFYEHTVNPECAGMFGTFMQHKTLVDGVHKQSQRILVRTEIVVYNVELVSKQRNLSLESLRCLARARPLMYPMPSKNDLPKSHIEDSDDEDEAEQGIAAAVARDVGKKKKAPVRKRKITPAGTEGHDGEHDGEHTGDHDGEHDGEHAEPPSKKRNRMPRQAAEKAHLYAEADTSEVEEDVVDDGFNDEYRKNLREQGDRADAERAADEDNADATNSLDGDNKDSDSSDSDADPKPVPIITPQIVVPAINLSCEFRVNTIVFLNMLGEKEFQYKKFPTVPVLLTAIDDVKCTIRWFQNTTSGRNFDFKRKTVSYAKYWTHTNWMRIEKLKKGTTPTREQVEKYWLSTESPIRWLLPLIVPAELYDQEMVWQKDKLSFPMEFVTGMLIPMCVHTGVVQER